MTGDKVFLDTNIVVYAYDISAGKKHDVAANLMIDLWNTGLGVISTQVLQEFFVIVTKKIPNPLTIHKAKEIIKDLLTWDVVIPNGDTILSAIDITTRYKYSFWDSLIITTAIESGASVLFTEDLSDGQTIKGLKIKNPFRNRS